MVIAREYPSDIAFTPSVKAAQERKGSRRGYARMEENGSWQQRITPDLASLIGEQISVFLGTASLDGHPYIQHRGGPPGFLKVVDDKTIAFADFAGNKQYISTGNLTENPQAFLFLIDYAYARRVKIWGEAAIVEGNHELEKALTPADYEARVEQVIVFKVTAWDLNCPQHIPLRFEAADVKLRMEEKDRRIRDLEAELSLLRNEPVAKI